jgi:hypothetical protein
MSGSEHDEGKKATDNGRLPFPILISGQIGEPEGWPAVQGWSWIGVKGLTVATAVQQTLAAIRQLIQVDAKVVERPF